jgi:hypothetical protein
MTSRSKFQLTKVTEEAYNKGTKKLAFTTVYDPNITEDKMFAQCSPCGTIEIVVKNPVALDQMKLGEFYYVDFTLIEKASE